jgi:hypothetical protein
MGAFTKAEEGSGLPARVGLALLLLFPGALTLYMAFNSGGMFEVTTAFGAVVVLTAMVIAVAITPEPLRGMRPSGLLACGLLACYAVWTLLSAHWSHSPGRSLVAFDRVLLYLAVLTLFACVPRTEARFRWLLRGLLVAGSAVALIGLTSRLLPGWWPTTTGLVNDRLSYPITYWNTFGLLGGMVCILAVHHASDEREPPAMRICGAALLPFLGATLLLTFSRGAILVTVVGIVTYLIVARPYGLPGGLLAVVPTTAIAIAQTYSAKLIHEGTPLTPAAIAEGRHLAAVLCACAIAATIVRALTLLVDGGVTGLFSSSPDFRRTARMVAIGAGAVLLIGFSIGGGPSAIERQYHSFFANTREAPPVVEGQRNRLLEINNDGRLPMWEVARRAYQQDPLKGTGAGTFQLRWERHRNFGPLRLYTYSLYLESLAELGLVGISLLGGSLVVILAAIAWCFRDPGRSVYAAGFALVFAWTLHASIDIDWQSPAVSVPVFAVAGLALARRRETLDSQSERERSGRSTRITALASYASRPVMALTCLAMALVPARMALAQTHLRDSVQALSANDCRGARIGAHQAIDAIDTGPRPYEVLAMCAARAGNPKGAVRWARKSVQRDPAAWEPHYVLALSQGVAGLDPRPEARKAEQADPLTLLLREAVTSFSETAPKEWREAATSLPFAME